MAKSSLSRIDLAVIVLIGCAFVCVFLLMFPQMSAYTTLVCIVMLTLLVAAFALAMYSLIAQRKSRTANKRHRPPRA